MKKAYILGGGVIIIAIALFWYLQGVPSTSHTPQSNSATTSQQTSNTPLAKLELTKPIKEVPLQNGGASKTFTVIYKNGVLSPSPIVVNQNDQIQLTFATSSVTYDLAASNFGYFLVTKDAPAITAAAFDGPKEITLACKKYCPQQGTLLTEKIIAQ